MPPLKTSTTVAPQGPFGKTLNESTRAGDQLIPGWLRGHRSLSGSHGRALVKQNRRGDVFRMGRLVECNK